MKDKDIKRLLKDKETFNKLLEIGHTRNEIWLLKRHADKLGFKARALEMEIQKKLDLSFPDYIGLTVAADAVFEYSLKKKKENRKE